VILFDELPRMPAFLERVLEVYGPTTEADPQAIAMSALTLVGCLAGRRTYLRRPSARQPVRTGPTCWNTLIAGASGLGRKSTAGGVATDMARKANLAWWSQAPQMPPDEDKAAPDEPRETLFRMPGGIGSSGEAIFDDVTPKNMATAKLWEQEGPPSTLLVLEESGPLFAPSGKRGPHHESLRRFLLVAYDGYQPGRLTVRGGKTLPGPVSVSSIGSVTVDELVTSLGDEAVSSGFLGRIVPVLARPTPADSLHPFWEQPDHEGVEALVRWLVAAGTVGEWKVAMTPEAEGTFASWYVAQHARFAQMNGAGPGSTEAKLLGRYQNLAQRLALALVISDWLPCPWDDDGPGLAWRRRRPTPPGMLLLSAEVMRAACLGVEDFARTVEGLVTRAHEEADVESRYVESLVSYLARQPGREATQQQVTDNVRPKRFGLSRDAADRLRRQAVQDSVICVEKVGGGRSEMLVWRLRD
jgi:hypothetical protein